MQRCCRGGLVGQAALGAPDNQIIRQTLLKPNRPSAGDPDRGWSDEFSFKTAPLVGAPGAMPYRLGLIGDLGQTDHSLRCVTGCRAVAMVWDGWGGMMQCLWWDGVCGEKPGTDRGLGTD